MTDIWPATPTEAIALQKTMASKIRIEPLPAPPRFVAAIDMGHIGPPRRPTHQAAGIVVYDLEKMELIERHALIRPVTFPYIPGLLSFREAGPTLEVIERVQTPVDVYLLDGQGLAHPRKFGIACHVGVLLDRPTIGCAKSILVGKPASELNQARGSFVDLIYKNEPLGVALRTRNGVKPVYVSVGHRITLAEAIKIVLQTSPRYRLPEPARMVHNYVTMVAKGIIKADETLPD
jgi:deoxyribonuclease V